MAPEHTYEVEVKALLGSKENADALLARMCEKEPNTSCASKNTQLNHYFIDGDLKALVRDVTSFFPEKKQEQLRSIAERATDFSLRSRQKNDDVFLVVKASVDDTSSSNGISRIEFEEPVSISLEELDTRITQAGFACQAKWSRQREEYTFRDLTVCLDKNAGYGYLVEFEKLIQDEGQVEQARTEIHEIMHELGVEELPQDRLERMFAHYNEHWPDYYGTENTFVVE